MVWILQFLIWVALASTSASNYGPLDYYGGVTYRRLRYDRPFAAPNPDTYDRGVLRQPKYEPIIPQECEQLGHCENIPNYPQDVVDRIISKIGHKLELMKVEELDTPSQRHGDDGEIELCSHREAIIVPQAAKGKDKSWHVILNNKHNPFQGYRVEICTKPFGSCANNVIHVFGGYTATCRQKYVQKTLLAVNMDTEDVFDMPVKVPSCCSCVASHMSYDIK